MKKILLLCVLVLLLSIPPSMGAEEETINGVAVDYDRPVYFGNNTYMTFSQIYAMVVFHTALQNDIDFSIAVRMALDQLR